MLLPWFKLHISSSLYPSNEVTMISTLWATPSTPGIRTTNEQLLLRNSSSLLHCEAWGRHTFAITKLCVC